MHAIVEIGSIACPNCGAWSDEPCAEWCATGDPRSANRNQKLHDAARVSTEGQKSSCAADRESSSARVASPSVNIFDGVEF